MHDFARPLDRSAAVGFSGNPLDRLSERRDDAAFVAALRADPAARSVVFVRDLPVLRRVDGALDALFPLAEAEALGAVRDRALLGRFGETPVFATCLEDGAAVVAGPDDAGFLDKRIVTIPGREDLACIDMRTTATRGLVSREAVGILGQAKSLFYWHARHRYCGICGRPTQASAAGWRRECEGCKATHFPRLDPVAIMLPVLGDACLMGRQPRFPRGMYSCLAGFIEAGETMEEAVRREIFEEVGVRCGVVDYAASQPWPFPGSLMVGFIAQAEPGELVIDRAELDDARWFSRDEARAMLAGRHPGRLFCPPDLAIANHILRAWLAP